MKTFKFGQLLTKEDICNRKREIAQLRKLCELGGRAVVYGPRRFGKTSLVKNVTLKDFTGQKKAFGLFVDLFQLSSMEDFSQRLRIGLEQSLSKQVRVKSFLQAFQNYLKNFRLEMSLDPQLGTPTFTLTGKHLSEERSVSEIFQMLKELSQDYKTLVVLDEFQDIQAVTGLEARLRSELQSLTNTAVILMGSKRHILREIFHNESKPFYGFGTDVEFREISRDDWLPYMQERFTPLKLSIGPEGVEEICRLMRDVPNAIQELCQWIALSGERGALGPEQIHIHLQKLLENKASRYLEKLTAFSLKERKVLLALAAQEPVSSLTSVNFLQATQVSATATRAAVFRLTDQGVLDDSEPGYCITDPLFRLYLLRHYSGARDNSAEALAIIRRAGSPETPREGDEL